MDHIAAIGSTCLGVLMGWLVRFFMRRFKEFTPQALGTVVSVLLGTGVVRFLQNDPTVWWFYPIGLLLGFILYTIIALMFGAKPEQVAFGNPISERARETGSIDLEPAFEAELRAREKLMEDIAPHITVRPEDNVGGRSYRDLLAEAEKEHMRFEVLSMAIDGLRHERAMMEYPREGAHQRWQALDDLRDLATCSSSLARMSKAYHFTLSAAQVARYVVLVMMLKAWAQQSFGRRR